MCAQAVSSKPTMPRRIFMIGYRSLVDDTPGELHCPLLARLQTQLQLSFRL